MRRIVISLSIIGLVAGVTLGITGAYFTDKEPIEENVFQAGTLDIRQGVNDLGNMTLSGLMPGVATEPQKLTMGNNGTLHAVIDKIEVTSLANSDVTGDQTNDVSAVNYADKINVTISDEVGKPLWKGTLGDLYGADNDNAVDGTDRVFLAKKGSGENYTTRDYWFTFELDADVTNGYQNEGVKATISVNATQVKDNEFDAAERLVANQNNDNGWDWIEDGNKGTTSSDNLYGVTAMGLLSAYEYSGNSDYFDAAEKAAYKLIGGAANSTWSGSDLTNADILFLQRMGKYYTPVTNGFTSAARTAVIDRWDAYHNDAQEVYDFAKDYREPTYLDLFYWDLAPLMEVTLDVANTISDESEAMVLRNNALDLAELVAADQHPTGGYFITSWNNAYAQLGQASAVQILRLADDMSLDVNYGNEITLGVTALLGQQQTDGSFKGGADGASKKKSIQTTAYAALALEMTGYHTEAQEAIDYIVSQQLTNGGWYEEEESLDVNNDDLPDEFPEANSEALRAIVSVTE